MESDTAEAGAWMKRETTIGVTTLRPNRYTTVPQHPGSMREGTLRAILRQAEIDFEDFLKCQAAALGSCPFPLNI